MNEAAKHERYEYMKQYRAENKERLRELKREWNKANPDKVREHQERYWERRAKQKSGV